MTQTEINWPVALRDTDSAEQAAAVCALRDVLLGGLRIALRGRNGVNESFVEDMAQESLLKILARLDQFQGRSQFTVWAQSIALNLAASELRRKCWQNVSLESLQAAGDRMPEPAMIADDVLGAEAERKRLVAVLRGSIEKDLTQKQRAAILGELHEMPIDQIVQLLGTNRSATYKMLHDARRVLKKRLHEAGVTNSEIQEVFQ